MDPSPFILPEDGWFHVAAYGEWPHKPTGLVQIIDETSADEIIKAFTEFRAAPNWPGVLIDFDHQSLDQDKPTVAAGWIVDLDKRPSGLWARVRWSDIGRQSIEGGRYRFISPVWRSSDCAKLDGDKIRPLKLMNCAITNDPNIRGLFPLSNSAAPAAEQISAPPMEIRPTIQQDHPSQPAAAITPPTHQAIPIPAPFSNAILANRTAWTPAETRRRYRFALANRSPVSDDQRKAMFARMGGGGGGGGGNRTGSPADFGYGPQSPATVPAGTDSVRPNPYVEQAQALRAERDALEATLPAKPERQAGFDLIDVDAAVRAAMQKPGATSTDVLRARAEAEAENASRRSRWKSVENYYKRAYKDKAAGERALKKHVAKLDAQFDRELDSWQKDTSRIASKIAELDTRIAATEAKAKVRDWDDKQEAADQAAKTRERMIRLQIAQDKETARAELARQRAADRAAAQPIKDAKAEAAKPALFWRLLSQGNKSAAMQLYPDANYAAAVREYAQVSSANRNSSNWRLSQQALAEFKNIPPPMGN